MSCNTGVGPTSTGAQSHGTIPAHTTVIALGAGGARTTARDVDDAHQHPDWVGLLAAHRVNRDISSKLFYFKSRRAETAAANGSRGATATHTTANGRL